MHVATIGLDTSKQVFSLGSEGQSVNTELWRVVGNDSTFVDRPIPFLRTLVDSEQLVMRTTPYNESPITAFLISPARGMPLSPSRMPAIGSCRSKPAFESYHDERRDRLRMRRAMPTRDTQ